MSDLRLVGVSNGFLDLVADDGTKHRLVIDAALESAARAKSDAALRGDLSPREIQAQIRAGLSIAEVAASTGETPEAIEKYAAPIVAELEHVIAMAKEVRLTFAAERFSDSVQVAFGTVMQERIEAAGGHDFAWRAKRNSSSDFEVSIEYRLGDKRLVAAWSFDPKRIFLSPQNEAAIQLSNGAPLTSSEPAKLRPVAHVITLQSRNETVATAKHPADRISEIEPKPALKAVPDLEVMREPAVNPVVADTDAAEAAVIEEAQVSEETPAMTETLVAPRPGIHLVEESSGETEYLDEILGEDLPDDESHSDSDFDNETEIIEIVAINSAAEPQAQVEPEAEPTKPKATRGSWDEVLFGSKIEPKED
jgi:hypothetical protein